MALISDNEEEGEIIDDHHQEDEEQKFEATDDIVYELDEQICGNDDQVLDEALNALVDDEDIEAAIKLSLA